MKKYTGIITKATPMLGYDLDAGDQTIEGYIVEYNDGYRTWLPKSTFEDTYKEALDKTDYGFALEALRSGEAVAREGWNGKGMWLLMQLPDENSKMTLPYIYIEYPVGHPAYPNGSRVPWLASQTDQLANDYYIVSKELRGFALKEKIDAWVGEDIPDPSCTAVPVNAENEPVGDDEA